VIEKWMPVVEPGGVNLGIENGTMVRTFWHLHGKLEEESGRSSE